MMNTIVQNILGDLGYKLRQQNIIESIIYVTINEEEIPRSKLNGWSYVASSNSLIFAGNSVPNEDDSILVRYGYSLR